MRALFRLPLTREASTLALMLTALTCLLIALQKAVPDAAMTLLLPIVLSRGILGFLASGPRLRQAWFKIILLGGGLISLFLRVGQFTAALIASVVETLRTLPPLMLPPQNFGGYTTDLTGWL